VKIQYSGRGKACAKIPEQSLFGMFTSKEKHRGCLNRVERGRGRLVGGVMSKINEWGYAHIEGLCTIITCWPL
jgi:hypothetical protein